MQTSFREEPQLIKKEESMPSQPPVAEEIQSPVKILQVAPVVETPQ